MTFMNCPQCGGTCHEGQDLCNRCRATELQKVLTRQAIKTALSALSASKITDEWNRDPERWNARPLAERLEMLRKYYCTGPSGQSASIQGTNAALNTALQEATYALWALTVPDAIEQPEKESMNEDQ